jgi:hypothetical protein
MALRPVRSQAARKASDAPRAAEPGGPTLGWALACAGLLLAAGVLGLTDGGRRSVQRGGGRLAGTARPLT